MTPAARPALRVPNVLPCQVAEPTFGPPEARVR